MYLNINDFLFLGVWAFAGSILGFCAFALPKCKTAISRIKRCCLSIGIGIFIAFPISIYLIETEHFSKQLSIMLGGLGSFGLPDFIIKHWSNDLQKLIDVFTLSKTNKDKNKY